MDHVLCSPSCSKDKMADQRQRALPTSMELACDEHKSISVPSLSKCIPGCCGIYQGSYTEFLRKKEKEVNMLSILLPALASGSYH